MACSGNIETSSSYLFLFSAELEKLTPAGFNCGEQYFTVGRDLKERHKIKPISLTVCPHSASPYLIISIMLL